MVRSHTLESSQESVEDSSANNCPRGTGVPMVHWTKLTDPTSTSVALSSIT